MSENATQSRETSDVVALHRSDGSVVHRYGLPKGTGVGAPVVSQNTLYLVVNAAASSGKSTITVATFDRETGREIWSSKLSQQFGGLTVIVSQGQVYAYSPWDYTPDTLLVVFQAGNGQREWAYPTTGWIYQAVLSFQLERRYTVSLLARGERAVSLRAQGIVLENASTGHRTTTQVSLVDHLAPTDSYDVVIVTVRLDQLTSILPMLAANHQIPTLLFMLNIPDHRRTEKTAPTPLFLQSSRKQCINDQACSPNTTSILGERRENNLTLCAGMFECSLCHYSTRGFQEKFFTSD